jgi:hypothetical protein
MKTFQEVISSRLVNLQEFENYRLEQIEIEKAKLKKAMYIILGVSGGLTLIFLLTLLIPLAIFSVVGGFIAYYVTKMNIKGVYIKEVKGKVLKKIVNAMDETFDYDPVKFIASDVFKKSNFIKNWSKYNGEDYFTGKVSDKQFECSEITVQTKSGKNNYQTVYRGMFFVLDYPSLAGTRIDIIPDTAEKFLGSLGSFFQKINAVRDKLIKFEDEKFEKEFVVYSNNEDTARSVVSTKLMDYLVELRGKAGKDIYLAFNDSRLFFGIDNRHDIFQVDIKNSLLEKDFIKKYYDDFGYYIDTLTSLLSVLGDKRKGGSSPINY